MKYTPTEADRLTGINVRDLRRKHGETILEALEGSGLDLGQSSFSRIELGQRALTLPEATKLAAHWNTTADRIFVKAPQPAVVTEQQLGNERPALFAVPEQQIEAELATVATYEPTETPAPLTPEQYRVQVWLPYLEARYAKEAG